MYFNEPVDIKHVYKEKSGEKRLIKPMEVAKVVSWICNENSSSINGQNIPIAGGEI